MNKEVIGAYLGTTLSAIGTSIQVDELMRYISLGITILGGIITLVTQIVAWVKRAKADGKITNEELVEGVSIVKENAEKLAEELKKKEAQENIQKLQDEYKAVRERLKEARKEYGKI